MLQTSTAPNSWATINLWRRYFEKTEQEEEEFVQEILDELTNQDDSQYSIRNVRPIQAPEVIAERQKFIKEGYARNQVQGSNNTQRPSMYGSTPSSGIGPLSTAGQVVQLHQQTMGNPPSSSNSATDRVINEPNLQVPTNDGDDFRYLAQ